MKHFLSSNLDNEKTLKGEISGIAYTGAVIPQFGWYENFIVDVSSTKIAKKKTAIFKNHDDDRVIGMAEVKKEENKIILNGKLSDVEDAKDVVTLAKDGFEWQLSIGVYGGEIEENFTGEVNGLKVKKANVLRNGLLREVSIVALGADKDTNINILKEKSKMSNLIVKLRKSFNLEEGSEEELLAKVEALIQKSQELETQVKELEEKVTAIEAELATKEKEVEKKEEELSAIKGEAEVEMRAKEIRTALSAKKLTVDADRVNTIAKNAEATKLFLDTIKDMKSKIDTTKFEFGTEKPNTGKVNFKEEAEKLIKSGRAKDMIEALSMVKGE